MPNNNLNQKEIVEQIDYLTNQLNHFSTTEKALKGQIATLETELAQKIIALDQAEKAKNEKITELTKAYQEENDILRREINQELTNFNKGKTLREAVNKFIKQHCRNERHVPTFTDKCLNVIGSPFNWVAKKTSQGFALFGFCSALPAIFTGLGWVLKAYMTVKTGGAYGAMTVANAMINKGENTPQLSEQQGGYIAPQGSLPSSNQSPIVININNPNEKDQENEKK